LFDLISHLHDPEPVTVQVQWVVAAILVVDDELDDL